MKNVVYRGIVLSVVSVVFSCSVYWIYAYSLRESLFTVHYDQCLSAQTCSTISTWFHEAQKLRTVYASIDEAQKQFPCIQSIRFVRTAGGHYAIFVQGKAPRIVWGLQHVITDAALYLPKEYYAEACLGQLPFIACNELGDMPSQEVMRSLLGISSEIFAHWTIHWKDQTNILLRHKQDDCCIQADSNSVYNKHKIQQAYTLFYAQHKHSKKHMQQKKRIYDIRFEKQILEYVMKGKWNDEKQNVI